MNKIKKWFLWIFILSVMLISTALFALSIGSSDVEIKLWDIPRLLFASDDSLERVILTQIRLPRVLLAIAIGGALSIAGVLLQGIFHNPLVEPYTLGISGGATLGVAFCIFLKITNLSIYILPLAGFVGSLSAVLIAYMMCSRYGRLNIQNLLLIGVMISFICSSLVLLIMAIGTKQDLQSIIFWVMGSLDESKNELIGLMLFTSIGGLIVSYIFCKALNAFSLGEEDARHLGIDTEKTKKRLFILASILTGFSVSVAGVIGFIGLAIPHIARIIFGYDHRILLITSFLMGAIFLILCDTTARTIGPTPLPVGVITGIVGGSIFVYALTKRKLS
ncbi:MAG: iron ABC transporter permease [Verrucomicrobiota bacterium]|nr:iron ABC transporter permease [Verrucomicrobiota bacterium]